jgi:hypothetical protein
LLAYFPELDESHFLLLEISLPMSGIPNADWTEFDPPKEITHFLRRSGEGEDAIHRPCILLKQYLLNIKT